LYPVRADILMSRIAAWIEGVVSIPSQKMYEKLLLSTSQVAWYTMETEAAWQAVLQHAASPEIIEQFQKTSAESTIDSEDGLKE